MNWLGRELTTLRSSSTYRSLPSEKPGGAVDLSSNDYLGLGKRVIVAPGGSGGARLLAGNSVGHVSLEKELARFKGTEAALVFSAGYLVNVGVIPALVGPGDLVLSDELNHASIVDGCRLAKASGARVEVYPHREVDAAGAILGQGNFRRAFLVTDGVFSMDGDMAPLLELGEVCQRYGAALVVDDAHGTGILGPGGRGTAAALGAEEMVDVHIGTLSKALGTQGGFVAGSKLLIEYLTNRCRTFIYATALNPVSVLAAQDALAVVRSPAGELKRQRLVGLSRMFRVELTGTGGDTPIIPLVVGGDEEALNLAARLRHEGVIAPAIRPPTVPPGTARLRISLRADLTDEEAERALAAFRKVRQAR